MEFSVPYNLQASWLRNGQRMDKGRKKNHPVRQDFIKGGKASQDAKYYLYPALYLIPADEI